MVRPHYRTERDMPLQRPVQQPNTVVAQRNRGLQRGQFRRGHRHALMLSAIPTVQVPPPDPHPGPGPWPPRTRHRNLHNGRAGLPHSVPPRRGNPADRRVRSSPQQRCAHPRLVGDLVVAVQVNARMQCSPAPLGNPRRDRRRAHPSRQSLITANHTSLPPQHVLDIHNHGRTTRRHAAAPTTFTSGHLSPCHPVIHNPPRF